jgi:mannose-6-phosphate isomerase-like protein (cupin superfamily)
MTDAKALPNDPQTHEAHVIDISSPIGRHVSILNRTHNHSLRAGQVILQPGEDVGSHTTGHHEELVIVQEGEGHFDLRGRDRLKIRSGQCVYVPPNTEHDVINTSHNVLRYIYVVAPTP